MTANNYSEITPSVAKMSNGDLAATWIQLDSLEDSSRLYSIYANVWDSALEIWGIAEQVYSDTFLIEEPVINFDSRDIAGIVFRGHDGFDGEIFFTSKEMNNPSAHYQDLYSIVS